MPPAKGSKRKSESSVLPVKSNVKKYCTRSSNRKQVISYNDDSSETENDSSKKIVYSDDDFTEDEERSNGEIEANVKKKKSTVQNVKQVSLLKPSRTQPAGSMAQQTLNTVFKPINVSDSNIKAQLDLSDSDSTSSSSEDEPVFKKKALINSNSNQKACDNNQEFSNGDEEDKKVNVEAIAEDTLVLPNPVTNVWEKTLKAIHIDKSEQYHEETQECPEVEAKKVNKLKEPKKNSKNKKTNSSKTSKSTPISVTELLKMEEGDQKESSEDDENWEKVESTVDKEPVNSKEPPKNVQIVLEAEDSLKKRKKGMDIQNMIRLKINRVRKAIQLDLHQVSLVGMLAHGYLVNKMLNDPVLMATGMSVVPSSGFPPNRTDLNYLEKLVKWIAKRFEVVKNKNRDDSLKFPSQAAVLKCITSSKAQSPQELVYSCVSLCRSLGILSRIVMSLQPLSSKVDPSELQEKFIKQTGSPTKLKSNSSTPGPSVSNKRKRTTKSTSTPSSKKQKELKNLVQIGKDKNTKPKAELKHRPHTPREDGASFHHEIRHSKSTSPSKSGKSNCSSKGKDQLQSESSSILKRTRRKSAEKPVKYEESTLEDSEFEQSKASKKPRSSKRIAVRKPSLKSKIVLRKSADEYEESSSDDSENEKKSDRKCTSTLSQISTGKKSKNQSNDSEELPLESNESKLLSKKKEAIDVWLEVWLEQEEQWISVDVVSGKIHCERNLERNASEPLLYVVAFNSDLTWKDVTARYASSFLSTTRKQRCHPEWENLLAIHKERPSPRSKAEDESLEKSLTDRPMPTSISELKNHPFYALQRHLLKFEAIYPPTSIPVGYIRSEPVFARECVRNLHSRETWLKEAKVVRLGEKAYKIVKARPKWDRHAQKMVTDQPLELFGDWQIEDYVPPPAVNGQVPRNAYGNVELFLPSMLPKGTTHLQIPGLNKVARKLGIDCAPAMTGWDYHGGWSHPVYDGYVVCEEHVEALLDAWQVANEEQELREREKKEKRVYGNWRRLIRGLLIKERIQAKYFKNLTEDQAPVEDFQQEEVPTDTVTGVSHGKPQNKEPGLSNKSRKRKK